MVYETMPTADFGVAAEAAPQTMSADWSSPEGGAVASAAATSWSGVEPDSGAPFLGMFDESRPKDGPVPCGRADLDPQGGVAACDGVPVHCEDGRAPRVAKTRKDGKDVWGLDCTPPAPVPLGQQIKTGVGRLWSRISRLFGGDQQPVEPPANGFTGTRA